jgi:AraC-like DNA-binding protein
MKSLARYAALNSYVEVSQGLGIDPAQLMRAVGLDPAGLGLPDRWIPATAIARLLERSAAAAGHLDFGLRLAERRRFGNLGPLSLVIREEPDVRSALNMLMRHENMYNQALRTRMTVRNGLATVRLGFEFEEPTPARQAMELAVGVLYQLLRGFIGPLWKPVSVCFTHPAPDSDATHRKLFGQTVRFEHEFNGIVCYATDLDAPNQMADPHLRIYAHRFLGSLGPGREVTTLDRVRELIELLLPTGRCSVDQVARSLGVDRRTVHRHLTAAGETFSSVLNTARIGLATHLVGSRRYSLTEVAELLSFASPSNFSRWFRGEFGVPPSQWRESAEQEERAERGAGDQERGEQPEQ